MITCLLCSDTLVLRGTKRGLLCRLECLVWNNPLRSTVCVCIEGGWMGCVGQKGLVCLLLRLTVLAVSLSTSGGELIALATAAARDSESSVCSLG